MRPLLAQLMWMSKLFRAQIPPLQMWKDLFLSFAETINFLQSGASAVVKDNASQLFKMRVTTGFILKIEALVSPLNLWSSKRDGNVSKWLIAELVVNCDQHILGDQTFLYPISAPTPSPPTRVFWLNVNEELELRITCFLEACFLIESLP